MERDFTIQTRGAFPSAPVAHAELVGGQHARSALLYVDPFRYIGDSVSHLAHLDAIRQERKWTSIAAVAGNPSARSLDVFTHASIDGAVDDLARAAERLVVIAPNYIDDQWAGTVAVCRAALSRFPTAAVYVAGRQLLIMRAQASGGITVLSDGEPELLSDAPVEVTQDRALAAVRLTKRMGDPIFPRTTHAPIVIAPLSSVPEKAMTAGAVRFLLEQIDAAGRECQVVFGRMDDALSCELEAELHLPPRQVQFGLDVEAVAALVRTAPAVIAVDSYVAHIATRLSVPNVVVYGLSAADSSAAESLLHHSALGFCATSAIQMPCLLPSLSGAVDSDLATLGMVAEFVGLISGESRPTARTCDIAAELRSGSLALLRRDPRRGLGEFPDFWDRAVAQWNAQSGEAHGWIWEWFDPTHVTRALDNAPSRLSVSARARLLSHAITIAPFAKLDRLMRAA